MAGFGDLLGGLGDLIGGLVGAAAEGVPEAAAALGVEALTGSDRESGSDGERTATYDRRLAGAPRSLNVNDR
jgi:hypothetical protein